MWVAFGRTRADQAKLDCLTDVAREHGLYGFSVSPYYAPDSDDVSGVGYEEALTRATEPEIREIAKELYDKRNCGSGVQGEAVPGDDGSPGPVTSEH